MYFDSLKYGEFPDIIYFYYLELFMLLFFISKLTEYSLAAVIATSFACFKLQYYTRKSSFILFLWLRIP